MRLIDADALKKEIDEWLDSVGEATIAKNRAYYGELMGCIKDTPTVEKPRGEWINHLDLTEDYCGESKQCSLCGYKDYNTRRFLWHKFCPNCGADMRGEGE